MINPYAPPAAQVEDRTVSRMRVVAGVPVWSKWIGALSGLAVAGAMVAVWKSYDFAIGFYAVPLVIVAFVGWYCLHRESDRFIASVRPEFAGKLALWGGTARWTKGLRRVSGYLFLTADGFYFCSRPLREQRPEMAIPMKDMAGVHATQGVLNVIDRDGTVWKYQVQRSQDWRNLIEAARVSASPWKPEHGSARESGRPFTMIPGWEAGTVIWRLAIVLCVAALLGWQSSSSRSVTVWPLVMVIIWGSAAVAHRRNMKRLRKGHGAVPGGPALCGGITGGDFLVATPGAVMLLHGQLNDPAPLVVPRGEVVEAGTLSLFLALRLRDGGLRTFSVGRPGQWASTLREVWDLPG